MADAPPAGRRDRAAGPHLRRAAADRAVGGIAPRGAAGAGSGGFRGFGPENGPVSGPLRRDLGAGHTPAPPGSAALHGRVGGEIRPDETVAAGRRRRLPPHGSSALSASGWSGPIPAKRRRRKALQTARRRSRRTTGRGSSAAGRAARGRELIDGQWVVGGAGGNQASTRFGGRFADDDSTGEDEPAQGAGDGDETGSGGACARSSGRRVHLRSRSTTRSAEPVGTASEPSARVRPHGPRVEDLLRMDRRMTENRRGGQCG